MKRFIVLGGRREPQPPPPTLTDMLAAAAPAPIAPADEPDVNMSRAARMVDDVARHTMSKVAPIVAMHGRTLENEAQANTMAMEVAVRLGLEAAQRTALSAVVRGAPLAEAVDLLDAALQLIRQGLTDHRDDLVRILDATYAGVAGGQLRP
jgi:hypothetical protein